MKVDFSFSDADVVARCEYVDPAGKVCGARLFGDAPVDVFRNWWKHKYEKHPEED